MRTQVTQRPDKQPIIAEWKETVQQLLQEVAGWARSLEGWIAELQPGHRVEEPELGSYDIANLVIDTPEGRLIMEPRARDVLGATGTIELYAWPTLRRIRLVRRPSDGQWVILTDSGIPLRVTGTRTTLPWDREAFLQLAEDLLEANRTLDIM